jgi:hypothetical protein
MVSLAVDTRFQAPPSRMTGYVMEGDRVSQLGSGYVGVARPHSGVPVRLRSGTHEFEIEDVLGEAQLCTEWDPSDAAPLEARENRAVYTSRFRLITARSEKWGICGGYMDEGLLATF